MNHYKSLLLFSATALLLVGGRIYADEVSQSVDQGQVPAAAAQTDSQENRQTTEQQILPAETNHQQKQNLPAPEEISQAQDATENQDQTPASFDQEASNQAVEEQQSQQAPVTESQAATAVTESESTEGQESLSIEEYEANVADLKQVTMADVYHMFDDQDGNYTLYIGRPTCHYCRDFSPVVKEFYGMTGGQVYYLNTDNPDFTPASKDFLRGKIGEYATPTILHLEKGQIVSGQLGSGGTAQELYNKVFPAVSTEQADETQTPAAQDTAPPKIAPEPANAEPAPTTVPEQSLTENKEKQVSSETTFDNSHFLKQVLEQAKSWLTSILEKWKA